jgi:hypothetical protein
LHAASELIRAIATLAWPVFALVAVLVFRRQLVDFFAGIGPLRRAKVGPVDMYFAERLSEAETAAEAAGIAPASAPSDLAEELAGVANELPSAAIMEAYARVEAELRRLLAEAGAPESETMTGGARLARLAAERGLVSPETVKAVEGMSVLRNLAVHRSTAAPGRVDVTREQAIEYLVLADSVLYAIRNPPRLQ